MALSWFDIALSLPSRSTVEDLPDARDQISVRGRLLLRRVEPEAVDALSGRFVAVPRRPEHQRRRQPATCSQSLAKHQRCPGLADASDRAGAALRLSGR